jgi:ligand-binding SRPBCC domain-containing protein
LRPAIVTRSLLDADPREVWAGITTFEGINYEFRPLLRMTAPPRVREQGLGAVVLGERLCRSWLLLFGVVPIDYDDITLVRLDEGRGFLERSKMLSQRRWEHERTIEPAGSGCVLTDSIRYEPRVPVPDIFLRSIFGSVFRYRHHRLRRRHGGRPLRPNENDGNR